MKRKPYNVQEFVWIKDHENHELFRKEADMEKDHCTARIVPPDKHFGMKEWQTFVYNVEGRLLVSGMSANLKGAMNLTEAMLNENVTRKGMVLVFDRSGIRGL